MTLATAPLFMKPKVAQYLVSRNALIDNEIAKKIFERIEVMKEEISDEVDEEREQEKIKLVIKKLEKLRGLQNLAEDQKIDKAKNLVVKQSLLGNYRDLKAIFSQLILITIVHKIHTSIRTLLPQRRL